MPIARRASASCAEMTRERHETMMLLLPDGTTLDIAAREILP